MAENLSNLEVSTIAIAESVADLKKRTDKFEKGIADSVNALVEESVKSSIKKVGNDNTSMPQDIVASVDEKGRLNLNGKPSDVSIVTPTKISEEIGRALGSIDTPSLILEEQTKFEGLQSAEYAKIAIEKGRLYIEDALPSDLRKKVFDGYYRKNVSKKDEIAIVRHIQNWYDKLPSNVFITSRGGYFPVTKNIEYKPEYYGADGRQVTVGGITLTVNGQQPCISFHHSIYNTFDFSRAEFCVEEMGQDVFHLCDKSHGNTVIHGGKITTRAYEKYGYKSGMADPDKRWVPHIDGWTAEAPHIGSGMSLKGVVAFGYNTTTYAHDLARYMNNSCDTSKVRSPENFNLEKQKELYLQESRQRFLSGGGYFNKDGVSAFPQSDGTTSPEWGIWHGGQIWSRGYGWRLFDCRNNEVKFFDVRGFTGGAVVCGLNGSPSGEDVQPGEVAVAIEKGCVAINTRITGGYFTHNYTCGVEAIRVIGYELCGIYAPDSVVGHPDAHIEHVRGWNNSIISLDPGYQQCTSRYLPMSYIYIHDNIFGLGKRKVMDIHTGNNVRLINNFGIAMYYGISTVIEEIFASKDGRAGNIADPYSFFYQDSNIEIMGNIIVSGFIGIHPINGATGVLARRSKNQWWLRCRQLIADNTVYAPRGLMCNYGHNHFIIDRNQFTFALPFGPFFGMHQVSGITVTNGGSGYTSEPEVIITGGGSEAFGAVGQAKIKDGKVVEIIVRRDGSRYTEIPTVTITGGGGSGATATASINTQTYGMLVGAEAKYGTMLATQVRANYVQNSPAGNYARQIVFGHMKASSIVGNHCDITPYSSLTKSRGKVGQPYVSESIKYRDGLLSGAFYSGEFDTCEVAGNFIHNQLSNISTVWYGKTKDGSIHKKHEPLGWFDYLVQTKIDEWTAEFAKINNKITELIAELEKSKPAA